MCTWTAMLTAFVAALAVCGPALARDAEGHRIVAHLAYERLTPKAKMRSRRS
jgi:hypothetical protein